MSNLDIIVLAAGKGERMVSSRPKVMHEIMGRPMIAYVLGQAKGLNPEKTIVVTGFGREKVESYLENKGVITVHQQEQKGTAHAILSAGNLIGDNNLLVLYGDVPLIGTETLRALMASFEASGEMTFMTTKVPAPHGYGRVITEGDRIVRIVEEADAGPDEKKINLINTGICIIPATCLPLLWAIGSDNKKGEYYLTDVCNIAEEKCIAVRNFFHPHSSEVLGVNTRRDLLDANLIMRNRILDRHMAGGVTFIDRTVYIEETVTIGKDTTIFSNCYLSGATAIGENVSIGPNSMIRDSRIDSGVVVEGFAVIEGAEVEEDAKIGPFSRIRPRTSIGKRVKIGNFVEVKNSTLREGSKASHLAYIGDTEIGSDVNIGAGTITCNYDGKKKHRTVIEDNVFVGSNTELVAPVKIGKNAVIGAGSTITKDVPEGALAVSRVQQRHIEGYGRKG